MSTLIPPHEYYLYGQIDDKSHLFCNGIRLEIHDSKTRKLLSINEDNLIEQFYISDWSGYVRFISRGKSD